MAGTQKWIGVCMSQAHTFLKTDFLVHLDRRAREHGYGILVFNSSLDYYWSQKGNNVTGCIYRMIRFDMLSALVILHENIYDMPLLENLIRQANKQKIPVLYLGGVHGDCISITDDYAEPYKEILRHIVRDHGARDVFYIAGLKEEENSRLRLRCWQEVMQEAGLPCGEDRFAYGNFLEPVAAEITENLIQTRNAMPRAICCANDSMAAAVCETLDRHGLRVPEDVIVTGFDGTPTAYLLHPRLTTCDSNPADLAAQVLDLIRGFDPAAGNGGIHTHLYRPVLSESCGCAPCVGDRFNAFQTFRQSETLYTHENTVYYMVDQILDEKDLYAFLGRIGELILPGSALYLNRSLLNASPDAEYQSDHPEEELIMIPHCQSGEQPALRKVYLRDMPVPSEAPGVTVLNIVHANTRVCGYYAAHTEDLRTDFQLIKRLSDVLNLIASIQVGRVWQRQLVARLENNLYMDSASELPNLKGLTRWFDAYVTEPEHRSRVLALTVYSIPRYSWYYETYGMAVTEEIIRTVSEALHTANPEAAQIARITEDQFVVVDTPESGEELGGRINRSTEVFYRQLDKYNARHVRPYLLEVNCGCSQIQPGWETVLLENLIHLALGEMYLNRLRENGIEQIRKERDTAGMYSAFNLLMEKNLFRFHFQPIVDAHTGVIYAYEALMRTDTLVNMEPLEILSIAREYGRLDEVEHATVFGIMERYIRNYSMFQGCKVFINTIPGHFLNEEDCSALISKYGSYLDCFVFELTEDNPTSDEELERLKQVCKPGAQTQIAIDDYGKGHSNIINLLRYSPHIIKIDRGLISGIANDPNRRLFVQNTIDFAHQNGIRALAEGVETADELTAVIECGIDLIQGFYTGRPSETPARAISEKVRNRIVEANLQASRFDKESSRIYFPEAGETVNLLDLALQKYTAVLLKQGEYTLVGEKSHSIDLSVHIADGAKTKLTLNHINIKGVAEPPIRLGDGSQLELILRGMNTLNKEGIQVPASASLTIRGEGNLLINNNRNYSVGIGANYNDPYGTIILDSEGAVTIHASGDKVVCLGGGRSAGEGIQVLNGALDLSASGINVVGIGSSGGTADILLKGRTVSVRGEGNDVILVGSGSGTARISIETTLRLNSACERVTGVGTHGGSAEVLIANSDVSAAINCDSGAIIGSYDGEAQVTCRDSKIHIHGEGNRISGFGSLAGACDTRIESGDVSGDLLAGDRLLLGNDYSRFIVTGGNIRLFPEGTNTPVSPAGLPLYFKNPAEDHYEAAFQDARSIWTYRADRNEEGYLGVWILR